MILGTHDRWFIDDLRPVMPFCAIDPDARLNDVFRTRSFYSTEELLTSAALFPVERICFASACLRLGAKKLRHFATDCMIYLARIADDEVLELIRIRDWIPLIRKGIDEPTRARVREMRQEACMTFVCAFDHHQELYGPRRRSLSLMLGDAAKIASGATWSLKTAARHSPILAAHRVAREYARCTAHNSAVNLAEQAANEVLNMCPVLVSFVEAKRCDMKNWAALFAEHYCDWRRAGQSMVEACDQADYMCSSLFYNDTELLEDIPDEHIESMKHVFRAARDAAVGSYDATYDNALHEAYGILASRMNEYVFGNPEPWILE